MGARSTTMLACSTYRWQRTWFGERRDTASELVGAPPRAALPAAWQSNAAVSLRHPSLGGPPLPTCPQHSTSLVRIQAAALDSTYQRSDGAAGDDLIPRQCKIHNTAEAERPSPSDARPPCLRGHLISSTWRPGAPHGNCPVLPRHGHPELPRHAAA